MKVIRARVLGFCMGVRRAVDMAERELCGGGRVCTMGPLIHNPQVLEGLRKRGAEILNEDKLPEDLSGSIVIIRAHGISPALEDELKRRGARIADATCPRVKASQMKARSLAAEGYRLFLAGEKKHGEIVGIQGYAPSCCIVDNPAEAEQAARDFYRDNPSAKTALIGQTTISPEEYSGIGDGIKKIFPNLNIINTICGAVKERQEALRELCGDAARGEWIADAVIVAGGKESSNTRRLLAIARDKGKPAWLVEGPAEIPNEIASYNIIGLCAGASTPDETIDAIEKALFTQGDSE
jgi:4-hydroxy-3-methylbut-2-enyl diphosphate reductase